MARKTTGSTNPRKKKTAAPADSPAAQTALATTSSEAPKNVPVTQVSGKKVQVNLDEEIRRRAYELYLLRNGAAGDPNRDWFLAEREIRSRYTGHNQTSAMAAAQGRN